LQQTELCIYSVLGCDARKGTIWFYLKLYISDIHAQEDIKIIMHKVTTISVLHSKYKNGTEREH